MNPVISALHERRSIRAYTAEPVSAEELQAVLDAAVWAPSAMNQQSCILVAVTGPEMHDKFVALAKKARSTDSDPYYGAPAAIAAFAPADSIYPAADCALALENAMLAAGSLGLGTCWINCALTMFHGREGEAFVEKLGLPRGRKYACYGSIALGHPAENPAPKTRGDGRIRIV